MLGKTTIKSFSDSQGRNWSIDINVDTLRRVKSQTDVDLTKLVDARNETFQNVVQDYFLMFDLLHALVEPQFSKHGITGKEFGAALDEASLESGSRMKSEMSVHQLIFWMIWKAHWPESVPVKNSAFSGRSSRLGKLLVLSNLFHRVRNGYLTGSVNNGGFRGFASGEVLFLGAGGGQRGQDDWEVTDRFAASPNMQGLQVGDITGIVKRGCDYLWIRYANTVDNNAKMLVKRPLSVYVEQVYPYTNFAGLGIGT